MRRVVCVLVLVAALGACSSSAKTTPGRTRSTVETPYRTSAAEITSCAKDPTGMTEIKGTLKNDTNETSDFVIEIDVRTADDKTALGTGTAVAREVEPGQTADWTTPTFVEFVAGEKCTVSEVTRTALN